MDGWKRQVQVQIQVQVQVSTKKEREKEMHPTAHSLRRKKKKTHKHKYTTPFLNWIMPVAVREPSFSLLLGEGGGRKGRARVRAWETYSGPSWRSRPCRQQRSGSEPGWVEWPGDKDSRWLLEYGGDGGKCEERVKVQLAFCCLVLSHFVLWL